MRGERIETVFWVIARRDITEAPPRVPVSRKRAWFLCNYPPSVQLVATAVERSQEGVLLMQAGAKDAELAVGRQAA